MKWGKTTKSIRTTEYLMLSFIQNISWSDDLASEAVRVSLVLQSNKQANFFKREQQLGLALQDIGFSPSFIYSLLIELLFLKRSHLQI